MMHGQQNINWVNYSFKTRWENFCEIGECGVFIKFIDSHLQILFETGDRTLVEARFTAPVQRGPGAYPASYTIGTGFLPG